MLVTLMPGAMILILIRAFGRRDAEQLSVRPWQAEFLIAGSVFGFLILFISEALGLFQQLDQPQIAGAWGLVVLAVGFYGWRRGELTRGWTQLGALVEGKATRDLRLIIPVVVLFILVFAVALVVPPNNVDTLQYHMPRVEQWTQNHSLRHFPTPYDSQNTRPYWAELAILNLRVLWGSDRPANLPQAISLLGVMIAASGIVALLGGGSRVQWLGAVIAFSVPMAVLQATTPKNDLTSGLWVLTFGYFVLQAMKRGLTPDEGWARSLSLGLGILTKGTVLPFIAPLLLLHLIVLLRRRGFVRAGIELAGVGLIVLVINLPFWTRNVQTYGGPYGSTIPVGFQLDIDKPFGERAETVLSNSAPDSLQAANASSNRTASQRLFTAASPQLLPFDMFGQASRILRMIAMHFVSPFQAFNEFYFSMLGLLPGVFSPGFVSFLRTAAWNNDMMAGNPLHLVAIVLSSVAVALSRGKQDGGELIGLMAAAFSGLFLVSFGDCADTLFCMRYQLSFFLLGAPVCARVVAKLGERWTALTMAFFLAYAVPYILYNNMRPVIGAPPWPTRIGSVFLTDPDEILFAQSPDIRDEWEDVAARIQSKGCTRVGLSTTRFDLEYALWWLLGAPESGIAIHHLRVTEATGAYLDPAFVPCAVICTACEGLAQPTGLSVSADYGHIKLYLQKSE